MDGIVTAVAPQKRRGGRRVNVFVNGQYAFSLERDLADLVDVGMPISQLRAADLVHRDEHARAFDAAVVFLTHRPRSEREIRDRLDRKRVPEPIAEAVIERLRRLKLIDDEDFARYWVEQRQTHRPRGSRLLRQELRQKGVAAHAADEILQAVDAEEDPTEAASRAARKKARTLRSLDERTFAHRLGQFLLRRGFDYDTSRVATRRLWEEVSSTEPLPGAPHSR